jgi:hypothetical protein
MANTVKTDPMQEMVRVFVPRVPGEDKTLFVGLNGKGWNIPRDEYVEVPKPVADIIMASQHNARLAREYSEAQQQAGKTAVAPDGSRIQI